MPHREPPVFEALEPRTLLSVSINVDYTFDTNGFFDDAGRRDVIEAAADYLGSLLNDSLRAITPSGPNDWSIQFTNPATGTTAEVDNPTIGEDELLLFVGGRDLGGDTLGLGGAGGWQASGTSSFLLNVEGRGQSGATGPDAGQNDTSLWGGSIVFDADTNWHFGVTTSGLDGNEFDFYSVAIHEMVHVLGFTDGTPAFANLISPSGEFMGPAAMAVSSDTQLDADDRAHWREGLASAGQETAMDPTFSRGTRKLITPLDFAALQDIGWELESMRWPGLGASIALSPFTERGIASGSTAPADPGLHWVEVVQTGVLDVRITSDQPVTLRLWDSQGLVAGEMPMADTITGLAISATDQFYSIEILSSSPATYDMVVSTGSFTQMAYYPDGFASPDIEQTITISNPTDRAHLFTLSLRYERGDLGRDADVVAFEHVIEPGEVQNVDIVRAGMMATDEPSGRSILGSQPYAFVLESTGALGAALVHQDRFDGQDITTSESFTRARRDTWYFAAAEKAAGVFDFLVFYNPNDHDTQVTMVFMSLGGQVRLTQEVRALARGGLNIQDTGALPDGTYGVIVTSLALDFADQPEHRGIVAAMTHFDGNAGVGWTTLGAQDPISTSGMTPVADLPGTEVRARIFNPGTTTSRLELVRHTGSGTEVLLDRFVPAGSAASIPLPDAIGYSYSFVGGSGLIQFVQNNAVESVSAASRTSAGTVLAFAVDQLDADDTDSLLRLSAANGSNGDATVTVRFLFATGLEVVRSITVSAMGYETLDIDMIAEVTSRAGDEPLAVVLESDRSISALLALLDSDNGWASAGMVLPA